MRTHNFQFFGIADALTVLCCGACFSIRCAAAGPAVSRNSITALAAICRMAFMIVHTLLGGWSKRFFSVRFRASLMLSPAMVSLSDSRGKRISKRL